MKRPLLITLALLAIGFVARYAQPAFVTAQTDSTPSAITTIEVEEGYVSSLPDYGPAPELTNEIWLNTDQPLPLSSLSGKVVLLEMWTFSCYNCVNTLPYVRAWHETYAGQGLVIIGNHYPEFDYESKIDNVRGALANLDIRYPVAQDNDRRTWDAYANRYWPVMYLIDKNGHLRYQHIGEGAYNTTEANIQDLLREDFASSTEATPDVLRQSITATTDVNVRSGVGIDQPQIGVIHPHEAFVVRGEQDGWYRINYDGQDGYVSGELVRLSSAVE
jgi:thiol-disulfide isomerase/thioredoxin